MFCEKCSGQIYDLDTTVCFCVLQFLGIIQGGRINILLVLFHTGRLTRSLCIETGFRWRHLVVMLIKVTLFEPYPVKGRQVFLHVIHVQQPRIVKVAFVKRLWLAVVNVNAVAGSYMVNNGGIRLALIRSETTFADKVTLRIVFHGFVFTIVVWCELFVCFTACCFGCLSWVDAFCECDHRFERAPIAVETLTRVFAKPSNPCVKAQHGTNGGSQVAKPLYFGLFTHCRTFQRYGT